MDRKRGMLLIFGTAFISGLSIFVNKFSVTAIQPDAFNFLKNGIAALLIIATIFMAREFKSLSRLTKKQWLQLVVIGIIGGSIPFLLFFKGLTMTNAAIGSFIHKTMFIYVAVLAGIFLKEKLSKTIIIPALLLLAGNALLLKLTSFSFGIGELMILIATLFWAGENVLSKHVLKDLPANIVTFGRMFFGSLFILIYLIAMGKADIVTSLSLEQYLWAGFASILLYLFVTSYYHGLKAVPVSVATSILLLGSPITTLLNLIFSDAPLALPSIAGILLIVLGVAGFVYIAERSTQAAQQHSRNES